MRPPSNPPPSVRLGDDANGATSSKPLTTSSSTSSSTGRPDPKPPSGTSLGRAPAGKRTTINTNPIESTTKTSETREANLPGSVGGEEGGEDTNKPANGAITGKYEHMSQLENQGVSLGSSILKQSSYGSSVKVLPVVGGDSSEDEDGYEDEDEDEDEGEDTFGVKSSLPSRGASLMKKLGSFKATKVGGKIVSEATVGAKRRRYTTKGQHLTIFCASRRFAPRVASCSSLRTSQKHKGKNMSILMGKGASKKKGHKQKNMSIMLGSGAGTAVAKQNLTTQKKEKIEKIKEKRKQEGHTLTARERKVIKDTFNLFDVDGSGSISKEELGGVMETLFNVKMDPQELAAMVKDVDKDGDGEVSFEEVSHDSEEQKRLLVIMYLCSTLLLLPHRSLQRSFAHQHICPAINSFAHRRYLPLSLPPPPPQVRGKGSGPRAGDRAWPRRRRQGAAQPLEKTRNAYKDVPEGQREQWFLCQQETPFREPEKARGRKEEGRGEVLEANAVGRGGEKLCRRPWLTPSPPSPPSLAAVTAARPDGEALQPPTNVRRHRPGQPPAAAPDEHERNGHQKGQVQDVHN